MSWELTLVVQKMDRGLRGMVTAPLKWAPRLLPAMDADQSGEVKKLSPWQIGQEIVAVADAGRYNAGGLIAIF
jgi:hypothetical protein